MILITGATGYIGSKLAKKLSDQGEKVRAMVIENDKMIHNLDGVKCEKMIGDITNPELLKKCMKGVTTVYHLAAILVAKDKKAFNAVNFEGTKNVINAAVDAKVKHFILISAAAAAYKTRTTYGHSKIKSEHLMRQYDGKINYTIIRPTLLYGQGGSQELKIYVETLRKFPFIIPTIGTLRAVKRPVWVNDIAEGLAKVANNKKSYGKTYNFGGGTAMTMWAYTNLIRKTFKINKPMIPIPLFICYMIAWIWEKVSEEPMLKKDYVIGAAMSANFEQKSAFEDLGYRPVSIEVGYPQGFKTPEDLF
ncbi:MAG: NAD-dependent epimerase/dehydratase family protein [Candidatus Woesearchaeota archaeon]|jgi:NADH dehydrogenase|nr:NAD-dependent epimerase/dehydratase family protein [Candidatus Woesearchaeota archaeon]